MPDVPFHEAASIFPMMTGDDLDGMVNDIRERGLMCPIETLDGKIIDGRNRYRACLLVPCEPDFVEVDGLPEAKDDPVAYVVSLNLHRRHMTPSQCAMVAAKAIERYSKDAKGRQGKRTDISANLRESEAGKASEKIAAATGVSARSVDHGTKVLDQGSTALVEAVESGDVSVSAAAKLADLPKAEQNAAVKGGKNAIKDAVSSPKPPKEKPRFGVSDQFFDWLGNIAFGMTAFKQDHGSLGKMVKDRRWDSKQNEEIRNYLSATAKGIAQLSAEMEKLCPR
jgi:hypothetical protein